MDAVKYSKFIELENLYKLNMWLYIFSEDEYYRLKADQAIQDINEMMEEK